MMNKMMKKVAIVFAAAVMAISGSAMVASANDGINTASAAINYTVEPDFGTFYVNNDIGLNVRALPSKAAASLGGLSRGDLVEVTGRVYENGAYTYWVQIHFNGQRAYVRDCLQTAKPAPLPTPASQDTGYKGTTDNHGFKADSNTAYKMNYTVSVAPGTYLALRNAKTSDDSAIIDQLYGGSTVTVIDGNGEFWYVSSDKDGRAGYVNSNYLV